MGERCNLVGSAKFKKLVDACKWDEAMEVCIEQCEKKADILDFNFDLIDGQSAMSKFMRLCVTEPTVARLPFMIDSSKWPVVEKGLKWVQPAQLPRPACVLGLPAGGLLLPRDSEGPEHVHRQPRRPHRWCCIALLALVRSCSPLTGLPRYADIDAHTRKLAEEAQCRQGPD